MGRLSKAHSSGAQETLKALLHPTVAQYLIPLASQEPGKSGAGAAGGGKGGGKGAGALLSAEDAMAALQAHNTATRRTGDGVLPAPAGATPSGG